MTFAVIFEDDPRAGQDIRRKYMSAHLAFLEKYRNLVLAAGPLSTTQAEPAGGLWLVEAHDEAEVQALVREDPFWPAGLRKSARVLRWTKVFPNGNGLKSE